MKKLSILFLTLAILLACVMCFVTGSNYSDMLWGIRCGGYSAPAWAAFLTAIPYLAGIAVCLALSAILKKCA